jgi:N-acetylneuraminate synthase
MDPKAMNELIEGAKILKQERGGEKGPVKEEQPTIDFAYATVVTIDDIAEGEEYTMKNIWVKRPGTGEILAEHFDEILGKKATRKIAKDTQLNWVDIEK